MHIWFCLVNLKMENLKLIWTEKKKVVLRSSINGLIVLIFFYQFRVFNYCFLSTKAPFALSKAPIEEAVMSMDWKVCV